MHKQVCSLILPPQPLNAAMTCQEKWDDVSDDLNALVSSSQLGTELFSFAVLKGLSRRVDELIAEHLLELPKAAITRVSVDALRQRALVVCESMDNMGLLPPRRVVTVFYRGLPFDAKVNSVAQQVALAVAADWKSRAVLEHSLPPFWAEELLFPTLPPPVPVAARVVSPDLVCAAALARKEADRCFKEEDGNSGALVWSALKPKTVKQLAVDCEFTVECLLMEAICGDGSASQLVARMLAMLPSASKPTTVEDCLQGLTSLTHSPLYRLAPKAAQTKVSIVMNWLSRILEGRPVGIEVDVKDDVWSGICERLPYFVSVRRSAGSSGNATDLVGKVAVEALLAAALAKHGDSGCTPEDIVSLRVWMYLLDEQDCKRAEVLIKEVESSTTVLKEKKKSGRRATASKDAAVAEAMALFS